MKKSVYKWLRVMFVVAMVLTGFGRYTKIASASEDMVRRYEYEGYVVTFEVKSVWDGAFNADVKVENTGENIICDWVLSFTFAHEIQNLWDATILECTETGYVIKNNDWNANINPGEDIGFGMTVLCDESISFPDTFNFVMNDVAVEAQGYSVEYISYSDWGTGCDGAVILTNLTSKSIENWELSFDYNREITDISNAMIVSHEQGHYVIRNAEYNADIMGMASVHIKIVAGEGEAEEVPNNFSMRQTVVGEDSIGTEDGNNEMTEDEGYASNNNDSIETETIIVDEMSFITWLINSTDEELLENGYTEEEIYEIKNYNYSEDILSLQTFTSDELNAMGYDEEQIQSIYEYDGEEDAIRYATTFGLSSARLSVTYYVIPLTARNSVEIFYKAEWNTYPLFTRVDCIAIAWIGCDANSYPIVMSVIYESHNADYYSTFSDEISHCESVKVENDIISYRLLNVDMLSDDVVVKWNGDVEEEFYAKNIWGCVALKTAADSYNLNNIMVSVGYSHTVIGSETSIGVDMNGTMNIGFSFSWRAEKLYSQTKNFKYDGTVLY